MICLFLISTIFSQSVNLNNYKYVVVPTKYYKFNQPDFYGLSSLTRSLFFKKGITALGENKQSWPEDLLKNPCLAAYSEYKDVSPLIGKTKIKLTLKDCKDEVLFEKVGRSSTESGVEAFHAALENAFEPIENSVYEYKPYKVNKIIERDNKYREIIIEKSEVIDKQVPTSIIAEEFKIDTSQKKIQYKIIKKKEIRDDNKNESTASFPKILDYEQHFKSYAQSGIQLEKIEGIFRIEGNKGALTVLINKENNDFKATVIKCTGGVYPKNIIVGLFKKSSLKDTYTVIWLNPDKSIQNTIAYLDINNDLIIDLQTPKGIKKRQFLRIFPE